MFDTRWPGLRKSKELGLCSKSVSSALVFFPAHPSQVLPVLEKVLIIYLSTETGDWIDLHFHHALNEGIVKSNLGQDECFLWKRSVSAFQSCNSAPLLQNNIKFLGNSKSIFVEIQTFPCIKSWKETWPNSSIAVFPERLSWI